MSETNPLVDGPMGDLRELTVDLFFSRGPESPEHFKARSRAVVESRRALRAAGYDIPGDPEWEREVMGEEPTP
jgi:hypothetical protein